MLSCYLWCCSLMAESVVQDLEQGSIYGLEKLWAFFAYSKVDLAAEGVQRDPKVTAVCTFLLCCMQSESFERAPMMFTSMLIPRHSPLKKQLLLPRSVLRRPRHQLAAPSCCSTCRIRLK